MNLSAIVSNPLGWDGDLYPSPAVASVITVSNPLGWDGDLPSR